MNKHELGAFKQGEIARISGRVFIVLDHLDNGVLVLQNKCEPRMEFGKNNDFRISKVKEYLNGAYLDALVAAGVDRAKIIPMTIDLKSDDGAREYGYDTVDVGLLTIAQYFMYNEFMPLADDWWMTASPYQTPNNRSPERLNDNVFWMVHWSGATNASSVSSRRYLRPALVFCSSLLVSKPEDAEGGIYNKRFTRPLTGSNVFASKPKRKI